ncbi:MAG: MATE family efflux transporter, partial [Oscillospiraceae bacterium]|nr:MATE family efflux transporter [Oscillospiraceae bacterium]
MDGKSETLIKRLIEPKEQIPEERKRFSNSDLKKLIFPIIVEQFLALLVGIADTLMVSYAGDATVSGVSLVNQLNNVFIMIFSALAAGGAVVASQYIGSSDRENGTRAASQLVMLTGLISVVTTVAVLIFGRQIFGLLFGKVEADVLSSGLVYLRISAYSFPFLAVYNACAGLFRSMGKTKTIMDVSIVMNIINVAGNAIGVFLLRAGAAGVAYPSLISRIFAAAVMLFLSVKQDNPISVRAGEVFSWNYQMVSRIFRIAVPNSVENGLFQIAKVALSSIVATFGTVQIAANGVAQSFWSMAALFCLAMGPAFITVIGQYMGAGDKEGAEYYMKKLLRITYVGGFVWNTAFFAVTPRILMMYNLSGEAKRLVIIIALLHNAF